MNLKTKIAAFLAAVLLSLLAFNLMASPGVVELMKIGKKAGYNIIQNVLAEEAAGSQTTAPFKG